MQNNSSNQSLFVVILSYLVKAEKIDAFRPEHLEFLSDCYAKNLFIASGMQIPRNGGIIIAKCESKEALQQILANDPFAINNLATYQIIEFIPTKWSDEFESILFQSNDKKLAKQ